MSGHRVKKSCLKITCLLTGECRGRKLSPRFGSGVLESQRNAANQEQVNERSRTYRFELEIWSRSCIHSLSDYSTIILSGFASLRRRHDRAILPISTTIPSEKVTVMWGSFVSASLQVADLELVIHCLLHLIYPGFLRLFELFDIAGTNCDPAKVLFRLQAGLSTCQCAVRRPFLITCESQFEILCFF